MVADRIIQGDAREVLRGLDAESVHCVVTSPPYWSLRDYSLPPQVWDDGWEGTLGLEPTVEMWAEHQAEIFREVWRVMRPDATLWVNIGDSYDDKQLVRQPDRLLSTLRADGWIHRSTIIWVKGREPDYATIEDGQSVGAGMPEAVGGWRWERCRVKVASRKPRYETDKYACSKLGWSPTNVERGLQLPTAALYEPCPGCKKCEANDGYVLRRGAWRPTTAHAYIFLLTKSQRYFCDQEAVREKHAVAHIQRQLAPLKNRGESKQFRKQGLHDFVNPSGRNKRSVWFITPKGLSLPHFAAFPEMLPEVCIHAGTSERGVCPECGSQWARVVELPSGGTTGRSWHPHLDDLGQGNVKQQSGTEYKTYQRGQTLGWRPTCSCDAGHWLSEGAQPIPATVLDPFVGSGTTAIVARKLGRRFIGIDLSEEYCEMARGRLARIPGWQGRLGI